MRLSPSLALLVSSPASLWACSKLATSELTLPERAAGFRSGSSCEAPVGALCRFRLAARAFTLLAAWAWAVGREEETAVGDGVREAGAAETGGLANGITKTFLGVVAALLLSATLAAAAPSLSLSEVAALEDDEMPNFLASSATNPPNPPRFSRTRGGFADGGEALAVDPAPPAPVPAAALPLKFAMRAFTPGPAALLLAASVPRAVSRAMLDFVGRLKL